MKTVKNVFCIVLSSIWSMSALAQSTSIAEGNSEYEKGRYFNAESSYRKALEKDQRMYEGNYNLGNALYKQNKFEEASEQYMNASVYRETPEAQNKSLYNLGNSFLKAEKYNESIEAYKKALKLNPDDEDARYNLSYALQKLKQQQQQQQNKNENKDQQQKKDQQQQQKDQQQEQKDQQQKEEQQQQKQQQRPKLTKEEAERMLRALKNDEKDLQKEKAKKFSASGSNPEKNR